MLDSLSHQKTFGRLCVLQQLGAGTDAGGDAPTGRSASDTLKVTTLNTAYLRVAGFFGVCRVERGIACMFQLSFLGTRGLKLAIKRFTLNDLCREATLQVFEDVGCHQLVTRYLSVCAP